MLQSKGNLDEAHKVFCKALQIYEASFGMQHPDSAASYVHVGSVLFANGDLEHSIVMLQNAHQYYSTTYGPLHPDTRQMQSFLHAMLPNNGTPA